VYGQLKWSMYALEKYYLANCLIHILVNSLIQIF
jgi:hypothetical protein